MNLKRIAFSGLITAGIGAAVGTVIPQLAPPPYQSERYSNIVRAYPLYGAMFGLISGLCVDTVFQLKQERDHQGE